MERTRGPLITREAPFWRQMLAEHVTDTIDRTGNQQDRRTTFLPPKDSRWLVASDEGKSFHLRVNYAPAEQPRTNKKVEQQHTQPEASEFTSFIPQGRESAKIQPKRSIVSTERKIAYLGAFAVGASALLGGISPSENNPDQQHVRERTTASAPIAVDPLPQRRPLEDSFELSEHAWQNMNFKAELATDFPPAMKAELKPKPKPKPKEQSHVSQPSSSRGSEVGHANTCAPNLSEVKQIVCFEAKRRGVANQWYAIDFVVNHESTWNPEAINGSSGACGLFQFLDCRAGASGSQDGIRRQAKAGLSYMIDRYDSPAGAYSFWQANGWY